jgi:hypothetical protein
MKERLESVADQRIETCKRVRCKISTFAVFRRKQQASGWVGGREGKEPVVRECTADCLLSRMQAGAKDEELSIQNVLEEINKGFKTSAQDDKV